MRKNKEIRCVDCGGWPITGGSVFVECFGTNKIPEEKIAQLVNDNFDMRPKAIIEHLNLRRPIYRKTAAYGHFGRSDDDFTWEKTDKAEFLRIQSGI